MLYVLILKFLKAAMIMLLIASLYIYIFCMFVLGNCHLFST